MAQSRDRNRFMRLIEAPGQVDDYLPFRCDGREMMSSLFEYRLTIRSQGDVPEAADWIGASITFVISTSDSEPRKINGQCVRFEHAYQKGGYVEFILELAPMLASTRLNRDSRIFTDVTVKDVVATILREHQVPFDDSGVKSVTTVRDYCVQHLETDYDFINRLLEEEGVFYFFKYDEAVSPCKHKLYLADDASAFFDGQPFKLSFRRDHLLMGLQNVESSAGASTGGWLTHDYDYKKPKDLSPVSTATRLAWGTKGSRVYAWPGNHKSRDEGLRRAKLALEEAESEAVLVEGAGSYVAFTPGARFEIDDQRLTTRERRIVIRSVIHSVWDPYSSEEGEPSYSQQFTAVPSYEPYRSARVTPAPVMRGPQTAVVLDQSDPEGFGRIKVRFHWDHAAKSTCWVRVAQQWAGSGIGAQFIPRAGMEVLVDFIDGDPDRPVVTGCLYNGDNKPPFPLPDHLSQTGWRTRSHPDGDVVSAVLFEDKAGEEEVRVLAGRDHRREVVRNSTDLVGQDATSSVAGNAQLDVGQNLTVSVAGQFSLWVGGASIGEVAGAAAETASAGSAAASALSAGPGNDASAAAATVATMTAAGQSAASADTSEAADAASAAAAAAGGAGAAASRDVDDPDDAQGTTPSAGKASSLGDALKAAAGAAAGVQGMVSGVEGMVSGAAASVQGLVSGAASGLSTFAQSAAGVAQRLGGGAAAGGASTAQTLASSATANPAALVATMATGGAAAASKQAATAASGAVPAATAAAAATPAAAAAASVPPTAASAQPTAAAQPLTNTAPSVTAPAASPAKSAPGSPASSSKASARAHASAQELVVDGFAEITLEAGTRLNLRAGGSSIELSAAGVSINGVLVRINS